MEWVNIPGRILARASRPGYDREYIDRVCVDAWIARAREMGIRSVLCLLDHEQMARYRALPRGLMGCYRAGGLETLWIPVKECQTPVLSDTQCERVWDAFARLPKPVLVHCSAGVCRTGAAIRHIAQQLAEGKGTSQ